MFGILAAAFVVSRVVTRLLLDEGLPASMVWHVGLMLPAWGILLPAGALVARYGKVTRGQDYPNEVDNLFWWDWHRVFQYAGVAASSAALFIIVRETRDGFATWHGRLGMAVMAVGWLQVLSAFARGSRGGPYEGDTSPAQEAAWRGDHYDMTPRRVLFEAWHKRAGWFVLAAAGVTILLGLDLFGADDWLIATVGVLQATVLVGVVDGHVRRRWVDTYAALWGPDRVHPGIRRTRGPAL